MNRLRSLAVTLIGFAFAAMGISLLFKAETQDDVVLGGGVTLFFAPVVLIGLMELMPASLPRQQADGRIIVTPLAPARRLFRSAASPFSSLAS